MSNGRPIRMEFETLRSIAAASIPSGTYVAGNIGTPMEHGIVQFKIDNLTDADLKFTIDGIHDHFVVPAGSFFLSDISSNQVSGSGLYLAKGAVVSTQDLGAAPTTGSCYLSVVFADPGY